MTHLLGELGGKSVGIALCPGAPDCSVPCTPHEGEGEREREKKKKRKRKKIAI